jgi:hypothetical protein
MLKEMAPQLARVAILFNPNMDEFAAYRQTAEADAHSLAIELVPCPAKNAAEIERSIASFAQAPNGGLLVPPGLTAVLHRDLIIELAARHRLPAVYQARFWVAAGGLMSYGGRPRYRTSAGGLLRRPHPARRRSSGPSGAGADQVRNHAQPENGEGARTGRAARPARRRRRGGRMRAHVHHAIRWRGRMAARSAGAATGDADGRLPPPLHGRQHKRGNDLVANAGLRK